jgi:ATP-dependent helicase/nuclease subunit A
LRFIEAQQAAETEPEVGAVTGDDCARLMSIHQSKGLEFPVVLVADLGKGFNLADLRADLIFDEEYGVCPQIKPPDTGSRYPSLPFWLARRRQLRELHGEELRLLYVAMTRARDLLLLTATITEKQFNERWQGTAASPGVARGKPVSSYSDWLGDWFAANFASTPKGATSGENAVLQWRILEDSELTDSGLPASPELAAAQFLESDATVWQKLQARLGWEYAFPAGILQPAKTSVTALRRQADDADAETVPFFTFQKGQSEPGGQPQRSEVSNAAADEDVRAPITGGSPRRGKLTAAERGTAHHRFMSLISLDRVGTLEGLHEEAARLEREQALTRAESKELDLAGIAAFWNSRVGREALAHPEAVRRELEFTARFSPNDLAQLIGRPEHPYLEQEFVVVQGVADLVLILPDQIRIVDFKTDAARENEVEEKSANYAPQLRLYARALSSIYKRPVTGCWLYFLRLRRLVSIEDEVAAAT